MGLSTNGGTDWPGMGFNDRTGNRRRRMGGSTGTDGNWRRMGLSKARNKP